MPASASPVQFDMLTWTRGLSDGAFSTFKRSHHPPLSLDSEMVLANGKLVKGILVDEGAADADVDGAAVAKGAQAPVPSHALLPGVREDEVLSQQTDH